MEDLKDRIIEKQKELIECYREHSSLTIRPDSSAIEWKQSSDLKERIELLEPELQQLEAELKTQQCHNIYKKVKEAWTPDKRSFEELEAGKVQFPSNFDADCGEQYFKINGNCYEYQSRCLGQSCRLFK